MTNVFPLASFLYTASEPEYVITNGANDSVMNVTSADGMSYIAGAVCDVEVSEAVQLILAKSQCMGDLNIPISCMLHTYVACAIKLIKKIKALLITIMYTCLLLF